MIVGGERVKAERGRPPGIAGEVSERVRMAAEVHQRQMRSELHAFPTSIALNGGGGRYSASELRRPGPPY